MKITTLQRLWLQQRVTRAFLPNLTPAEFLVLSYILDRTIMWGRASQRIAIREFENGNKTNGGLPLSRRTIVSALGTLKDKGVVDAFGNQRSGKTYSINFDWSGAYVPRSDSDEVDEAEVH